MDLAETLLALERRLTAGDAEAYQELLIDDAIIVVPGMSLDKDSCVAAIEDADGWDDVSMEDVHVTTPAEGVATVTYRFRGRRGNIAPYVALMSSVYAMRDGNWRLALHQQTPL